MKKLGIIILFFTFINYVQAHDLKGRKKDEKPGDAVAKPQSKNFIINFSKQATGSELSIYDLYGNYLVKNISLNEEYWEVNLSNQTKGIYFIEIINGTKKCISKVVIQ